MKIFIHPISKFNEALPNQGKLLDIGALNFSQYKRIAHSHPQIEHYGLDYCQPTEPIPNGYNFVLSDLNKQPIPFEDDKFDYIVASHVIEHLDDPLNFYRECMRVLKPNGLFYLEAPSENSLFLKGMKFAHNKMLCLNLYDDPTHTKRPWTPQSYYRLARYFGCEPITVDYIKSRWVKLFYPILISYAYLTKNGPLYEKVSWLSIGWAAYMISTKKQKGNPEFNYFIPSR
jgi:SAM-dependent methyltransferase